MPQAVFKTKVKYKNNIHKANEPFYVDAEDVGEMQALGGMIIDGADSAEEAEPPKRGKKKAAGETG